jgi:hypothetical protein
MKLLAKQRDGAKVSRTYDDARTPFQRLLTAGVLDAAGRERLEGFYQALDPVRLLQQLECLQDALWRHALVGAPPVALAAVADFPSGGTQRFLPPNRAAEGAAARDPSLPASGEAVSAEIAQRERRQYRRSGKPRAPRDWRTRKDPFEEVWEEVSEWLTAAPERNAKSLLQQLQAQYPERYPDGQLRTLQRRVKEWRGRALLEFDHQWLNEELTLGLVLPGPLRAIPTADRSVQVEPVPVG